MRKCKIYIFTPSRILKIFNNITAPNNVNQNFNCMKSLWLLSILLTLTLLSTAQKADFKAAEKFREDNLTTKYGDLEIDANWIEESDIFWYTYKTSEGRNFYYVNAATKLKQPMFDSRYMAAELHKITHHPYNELDLPIKEIKFEKKSTTRFSFLVNSIKFNFDIPSQKLVLVDTIKKTKKKQIWANFSPDSTWIVYS